MKYSTMGYTIISARKFGVRLKCTIHRSGKMGFTDATSNYMKLASDSMVQFAIDDDDSNVLYLIHCRAENEDAFKVTKSGSYYYVNTKALFDALGYDYINHNIMFDMVRLDDEVKEIYKLTQRKTPRK